MRLELPKSLHYPVTIQKIEKRVGDDVNVRDTLFTYSYVAQVEAGDKYTDEVTLIDKIFVTGYNSPFEGIIEKWFVWEGDVVTHAKPLLDLIEPCKHSVQFNGMCTECGKDMTGIEYAGNAGTDRAPIQIAHDTDKLLVSHEEANEEHEESKKRLLASRKLSLVVDLDQTIIHAAVDPTIGEWQNDPENPNYEAVKDVRTFQLKDDGPSMRGCWYYIKMRPGLEEFLENVAERYELHIYTMGTRQYAEKISEIVDPDKKFFSNRVLSRDESGSMTVKSLTRLFPVDDKMVVIIDDRADVWKWWPNLVRVSAFDFFPAIGDINGALLPKKQELLSTPRPDQKVDEVTPATNGSEIPANGERTNNGQETKTTTAQRDEMAPQQSLATSDPDVAKLEEMQKTQEETIANQVEDKPLLKLQQRMDEQDSLEQTPNPDIAASGTDSDSTDSESGSPRKRHSILRNDDEELIHLERHLRTIHDRFFNEYDRKRAGTKGGRVAALAGKRKAPLPDADSESPQSEATVVPDTKKIIPAMKERILDGVTLVFSSVIPLGADVYTADISMWARSFGATIADKVGRDVTHVIAARPGTAKVKTAVKRGIPVVSTHWLMQSIQRWKKLDVKQFLLPDIGQKGMEKMTSSELPGTQESLEDKLAFAPDYPLSSDEDTAAAETDDDNKQPKRKKLRLDHIPEPNINFDDRVDYSPTGDVESPVEFNADEIQDMQDELAEFMGSDMESDSDAESVRSERSIALRERKGQKRRRDDNDEGDSEREGEASDERNGARPLAKIQKGPGGSALRAVSNAQAPPALEQEQTQEEYDADLAEELARELEDDSDEDEDSSAPAPNGSS